MQSVREGMDAPHDIDATGSRGDAGQGLDPRREDFSLRDSRAHRRHLKRQVQGAVHRFAVVVPPEMKDLCLAEVRSHGLGEAVLSQAGVEFSGTLSACYSANLWLRTASRILCRVHEFRAGAMEELFRQVSSFRWELWLSHSLPLRAEAHVFHSRIQNASLVEKTIRAAIGRRFRDLRLTPPPEDPSAQEDAAGERGAGSLSQRIITHLDRNRCLMSIDTTGANLHERGYRLRHTGAPLRETLAAGILMKCGWNGEKALIDGMTGSGTLPIEAALVSRRLAPGMNRGFLFESWPSFNGRLWGYLRKKALERAIPRARAPIVGVDGSLEAVQVSQANAERAGVGQSVQWVSEDFFDVNPMQYSTNGGLLTLNPPYGRRLEGQGRSLFEKIGTHLRRHYQGWQVAVLAPGEPLALALKIRGARLWQLHHGGLPIWVVMAVV